MAHDVFISYASSDKAVADAVCSQLESIHRIRCWIAPRDVTPGASWAESIIDALDGSKVMVLIFSSKANASMQIEREVERAVHKGINIIPLRIENTVPTKTLEYFISSPHWLDAISVPLEQHIDKLAASVKALLSKQGVHTEAQRNTAPVAVPPLPPPAVPAHVTAKPPAPGRGWIVPAVITLVVAGAALAIGIGWGRAQRETNPAPAVNTGTPAATPGTAASNTSAPVAASAPAPVASSPTASSTPPPPAADVPPPAPAPAPATTAATTAAPAPTGATAAPAAAPAAVPRNPNLFVDFRNTITEGSVTLEVDGQARWTSKLGASAQMQGQKSENLRTSLSLAPGKHTITATLHTPEGKVRDTETTSISLDANVPRTLRMTLSRFRHHVEFETVIGKPAPEPMPAGPLPVRSPTATKPKAEAATPAAPAK